MTFGFLKLTDMVDAIFLLTLKTCTRLEESLQMLWSHIKQARLVISHSQVNITIGKSFVSLSNDIYIYTYLSTPPLGQDMTQG